MRVACEHPSRVKRLVLTTGQGFRPAPLPGAEDTPAMGERPAAAIPGAQYYCAADAGHWAQFEHADEHNRVVLRFLTGDAGLEPLSVAEDTPVSV